MPRPASEHTSGDATSLRTHLAGALRREHVGQTVRLGGWVHRRRDLGSLIFVDLRDAAGLVQVSFDPAHAPAALIEAATQLGSESVVLIEGVVAERPEAMWNPEMPTGQVEIRAASIEVVGPAVVPAIPVALGRGEVVAAEELRLRHRSLDLRRADLQRNLRLRHALMQAGRQYLADRGYLEIETPILTKPTPEGARDYLVPSRVHPGEFYALPQSPQLYKQILMISGFDRYFQIARCFRDEDLRQDRQPEFTQIDIEASFIRENDIMSLTEGLIGVLWKTAGFDVAPSFARMTYADAMERYGCDRPDLRYELPIHDVSAVFAASEFGIARSALDAGGRLRSIVIPGGAAFSRKQVDELEAVARGAGAAGLIRLKCVAGQLEGGAAKFLPSGGREALSLCDGDLAVIVAAKDHIANPALDRVRQEVARRLSMVDEHAREFLWVTDFPLFDRAPESGALVSVHHPFTAPNPDDIGLLDSAPERVRALAYDIVLNGTELGGGSIRISDPTLQSRMLGLLGIDEATASARFGFLLEALRSGAPPHGGIALGFDRIAMQLSGASSLRDVIAFPKTTAARALFEGAPTRVPSEDLEDLHLRVETTNA